MATSNAGTDLMDQISPTLAFETSMKEIEQNGHDDERILLVFNALDQIIPQLGVFSPITAKLRQELFDFVYSDHFTVEQVPNRLSKSRKRVACMERLSYKVLCHRLIEQHHDESNLCENRITDMKTDLANKNCDLNQALGQIDQIEGAKKKIADELAAVRRLANDKDDEIQNLNDECERIRFDCKEEVLRTQLQVKEIMENQAATEALIDELSKYKQGFDEMKQAFIDSSTREQSRKKRPSQADDHEDNHVHVKNQLMLDIRVATRLEDQLLTSLNIMTEDYDQLLDHSHTKLMDTEQNSSASRFIWDNIGSEQLRYADAVNEVRDEIRTMQRHRSGLEEKLAMIASKQEEELKDRKATRFFLANETAPKAGKATNRLRGLEHAYESAGHKSDLIGYGPQERALSRFAYMLASSKDGRAWADFQFASFCDSCAEQTYLCPHKFAENSTVVRIPDGTKYLRISRPMLKYNESLVRNVMVKNQMLVDQMLPPIYQETNASIMRTNYPGYFLTHSSLDADKGRAVNQSKVGILVHSFDRVWADYRNRTTIERAVPRPFALERLFTLIIELLAYECRCDHQVVDVTGTIVDDVYEFFKTRYSTLDEITYNAVHDFFTSLVTYKDEFKMLELFMHVLIGNLDVSAIYYTSILSDLVDTIEWNETEDIRVFFENIYPFLDEEGLDTAVIDFVSFAENKISRFLVIEFILSSLIKGKEPLFQEMQYRLSVQVTQNVDMMNELEFRTVMEDIAYTADERRVSRLFRRAERHSRWDNLKDFVSTTRLAHIAAFFSFAQWIGEQKEPLNGRIRRQYVLRAKDDAYRDHHEAKQVVQERAELIKYSSLQQLAKTLDMSNVRLTNDDLIEADDDVSRS